MAATSVAKISLFELFAQTELGIEARAEFRGSFVPGYYLVLLGWCSVSQFHFDCKQCNDVLRKTFLHYDMYIMVAFKTDENGTGKTKTILAIAHSRSSCILPVLTTFGLFHGFHEILYRLLDTFHETVAPLVVVPRIHIVVLQQESMTGLYLSIIDAQTQPVFAVLTIVVGPDPYSRMFQAKGSVAV